MTGSGKTGLCLSLIEEAAIDGVPDDRDRSQGGPVEPAADVSRGSPPADFRPWIDEDEARRAGLTPDAYRGAAGRDVEEGARRLGPGRRPHRAPARGRRLRHLHAGQPRRAAAVDPVVVQRRRRRRRTIAEATGRSRVDDRDGRADAGRRRRRSCAAASTRSCRRCSPPAGRRAGTSTSAGAHPGRAVAAVREDRRARRRRRSIPSKERFALATKLNAVLASPGFEQWLEGEPLDPGRLLYGPTGKPRVSIVSIAHLDDAHRMFFVSLLLNEIVAWMRRQSGTSSLRAIVYMDEIAGYFPPVANPPAKAPLLTLLKQGARLRRRRRARDAEHRRPRLQGARQHRHVVPRAPADRARQGARARRARRGRGRIARSRGRRPDAVGARQARVPAARRPRRRADHVPEPLGDVVPARTAVARADSDADRQGRRRSAAETAGDAPTATPQAGHRVRPADATAGRTDGAAPVLAPGIQQYFLPAQRWRPALHAGRARRSRA